jgi:hypothetical protein
MTIQIWSLINFDQKIPQFRFILKTSLFSVCVPNYEERKVNLRKPYLNISARLVASSCSISDGAHDLISRLILSVLVCRLIKIILENLGSQNKLICEYPINVGSG